jgi:hypothetical protein
MVPFDHTSCGVTRKLLTANRGTDASSAGQQAQIIRALCRALLGDGEGPGQIHSHQNVERYRRLLKTATDKERQNYLSRLILEEQQKQKDAGDSEYQY